MYSTDNTFRRSSRPLGTTEETKEWCSEKHNLFGYKVDFSDFSNEFAVNPASHARGNTLEIEMFQGIESFITAL